VKTLRERLNAVDANAWKIRHEQIYPRWKQAIKDQSVRSLSPEELNYYEPKISEVMEDQFGSFFYFYTQGLMSIFTSTPAELFSMTGAPANASISVNDLSFYISHRGAQIVQWAEKSEDPVLRDQARQIRALWDQDDSLSDELMDTLKARGLLRRIFYLREEIGAAVALGSRENSTAIAELQGLLNCESTPLL
jgi:hypothetical protein